MSCEQNELSSEWAVFKWIYVLNELREGLALIRMNLIKMNCEQNEEWAVSRVNCEQNELLAEQAVSGMSKWDYNLQYAILMDFR